MQKYNPFRPNNTVTPGMFCGRLDELDTLEKTLFQTKNGNPQHFLIHGERGIGKSSLMMYFQAVAEGAIDNAQGQRHRFVTVSVELQEANTYADLVRKIGSAIKRVVAQLRPEEEIAKDVWKFLTRWEVMGVKYKSEDAGKESPHDMLDELVDTVERTMTALGGEFEGMVILIDEADKAPATANLGEFCKIFTEKLPKRGRQNVMLGLAGLSGVLTKLKKSHESAPRLFEILTLEPLSQEERIQVVERGLTVSNEKNGFEVKIAPAAATLVAGFSEGYPHFIQQFAYSAFDFDSDNSIDDKDVMGGAFKENGALQQLGLKYFEELYFDKIGSDEYRSVLRAMSEHSDGWVTKKQLQDATKLKPATLNNAIKALKDRGIIVAQGGTKGVYRLPTKSFAVWISVYTKAPVKPVPASGAAVVATALAVAPPAPVKPE